MGAAPPQCIQVLSLHPHRPHNTCKYQPKQPLRMQLHLWKRCRRPSLSRNALATWGVGVRLASASFTPACRSPSKILHSHVASSPSETNSARAGDFEHGMQSHTSQAARTHSRHDVRVQRGCI